MKTLSATEITEILLPAMLLTSAFSVRWNMMNLGNILKNLEGMSGTLYMKDFDSENATASFSKN